ncbi:MAG: hypothetical protein WC119_00385 [Synergistaceae bacterium]
MRIYKIASAELWYHGSVKDFDQFNDYSWFTSDKNMASDYISWSTEGKKANVLYTVRLSASNYLDLTAYDMDDTINIDDGDIEFLFSDIGIKFNDSNVETQLLSRPDIDDVSTSWVINNVIQDIHKYDGVKILESGILTCCVFSGKNVSILDKNYK